MRRVPHSTSLADEACSNALPHTNTRHSSYHQPATHKMHTHDHYSIVQHTDVLADNNYQSMHTSCGQRPRGARASEK